MEGFIACIAESKKEERMRRKDGDCHRIFSRAFFRLISFLLSLEENPKCGSCGSAITRAQFREFAKEIGRTDGAQLSSHLPFTSEDPSAVVGVREMTRQKCDGYGNRPSEPSRFISGVEEQMRGQLNSIHS